MFSEKEIPYFVPKGDEVNRNNLVRILVGDRIPTKKHETLN